VLKQYIALQAWFTAKFREERGATAVEYGLLVVLIAAVIVATVVTLGTDVKKGFDTVEKALP
jgi:pilus assembly protein Flp/PilA